MALPSPVPGLVRSTEGALVDSYARVHTYLRISVTDRCNYRCTYCMPAEGLEWMQRDRVLSYEEIVRLVRIFAKMGIQRVRLTGGEPTLRRHIDRLIKMLNEIEGIEEISMTSNGHAFAAKAEQLAAAGLRRVNFSLDTLDPDKFKAITRGGELQRVLDSIDAALALGLTPVKINCVVVGGENESDVMKMVEYFSERPGVHLRFIEFMPFGGASRKHVPVAQLRKKIAQAYSLEVTPSMGGGPSRDFMLENGLVVGFISPMTEHFCDSCNRLRLQADGSLRTCLSRDNAPSLRDLLRNGATDADLEEAIRTQVFLKVAGHEADKDGDFRAFEGVMTQVGG